MTWITSTTKILSLLLILSFTSCTTPGNTTTSETDRKNLTLRQHLKRTSGVTVTGTQENTKVLIRASGSLYGARGKQPLFVVDGSSVGRSFYDLDSSLSPEEIVSVKILRADGANMYGQRGGQGVIIIETTRSETGNKKSPGLLAGALKINGGLKS